MEKFDKIKEFEEKVQPLLFEIREKCRELGVPMLINCLPYDDDKTTNSRTLAYFGEEGAMKDRNCTLQIAVMTEVAGLPYQLQMLLLMMIQKFKTDFKDQLEGCKSPRMPMEDDHAPRKPCEHHAKHGEASDADILSPNEEAMLNEVLKNLGAEGPSEDNPEGK